MTMTEAAGGLRRGLSILDALGSTAATDGGGLGVVQLAAMTGQDKSAVSRILSALAGAGYVERDAVTRRYRLGWKLFALGARAGDQRLVEAARRILPGLVAQVGETAHVSVLQGADVLTLHTEPAPRAVASVGWVGRVIPAYCTSSGHALLLDHTRQQLADRLAGVRFAQRGPRTVRSVDGLYERVLAARAAGFAIVDEESDRDLSAVGAPIRDAAGRIAAALNVSGPRFRLRRRLVTVGRQARAAADQMSAELGWRPAGTPLGVRGVS